MKQYLRSPKGKVKVGYLKHIFIFYTTYSIFLKENFKLRLLSLLKNLVLNLLKNVQ